MARQQWPQLVDHDREWQVVARTRTAPRTDAGIGLYRQVMVWSGAATDHARTFAHLDATGRNAVLVRDDRAQYAVYREKWWGGWDGERMI
jgi:hypothetical protein